MRVGTLNRHARFERYRSRFPTLKGENPPQGIRFRAVTVWLWPSRRVVELRWWRW